MKEMFRDLWGSVKEIYKKGDKEVFKGLLFMTVILAIYCYFGIHSFFSKTFSNVENLSYWKYIYHHFTAFILFFVFGIIYIKLVMKKKLRDFGLGVGNWRLGLKLSLLTFPIFVISGLTCIFDQQMSSTYPLARSVIGNFDGFAVLYYLSYLFYYIGWEFLFRGIGIFSFTKKHQALTSIVVSTMISALIHATISGFGKPMVETFSAIVAGFIFGFTAYKTKSIWYSLLMHVTVGFATDLFISTIGYVKLF